VLLFFFLFFFGIAEMFRFAARMLLRFSEWLVLVDKAFLEDSGCCCSVLGGC